jgi:phosphoribosylformylglycinamidine synthase
LAIALAESCISGKLGAEITLPISEQRLDEQLFGEAASKIMVSVKPESQAEWEAYLQSNLNNTWQKLGVVGTSLGNLTIVNSDNQALINLDLASITEPWQNAIARRLKI